MTCFDFRRLLLVYPLELTADQQAHASECAQCAKAANDAATLDSRRAQSVMIAPPEAFADKILLRQKMGTRARYGTWAIAATLVIGVGIGTQLYRTYDSGEQRVTAGSAIDASQDAAAAISFVLDHEPRLLQENRSGDPAVMYGNFQRLGLNVPGEGVSVRYLGKCPVAGGTGDHIVLETPQGRVTLILVPQNPVGSRVLVAARNMTALASPSGNGGYIVVAHSREAITRIERMLKS